jgi:aerobic carbon-monoxide dehydrogenase medium subunit
MNSVRNADPRIGLIPLHNPGSVQRGEVDVIPGAFSYSAPGSVPEAIELLGQYGHDAKILAGGQSLIPVMRFRLLEPKYLIDITRILGMNHIEERNGYLSIGALARESDLERSSLIRNRYPIIYDCGMMIADPLVRNLATLGGNLVHADPGNDHPATMLALRAEVIVSGPHGERTIPLDDLCVDSFATSLEPDEILTEIRVPAPEPGSGGAYAKLERKVGDYAVAATAAHIKLGSDGTIQKAGVALTNASYIPIRASNAESTLVGETPSDELIRAAAQAASEEADPSSDLRGSADYKRAMIRTMTRRALTKAVERARANA